MAMDIQFSRLAYILGDIPIETNDDLQRETLEALEEEALKLPSDKRQQFLDHVNQHAGDIIKFLDYLDAHAEKPFDIMKTARLLFKELREIGVKLAQATDSNSSQGSRELSRYEPFRNFQVSLKELSAPKKRHTPTFKELLAETGHAISEDNVRQNMELARLMGGAIRAGSTLAVEGAIMGACNIHPIASMSCKVIQKIEAKAGHPIQQAFAQLASLQPKNQALSLELYSQYGIPLEEGRQYGKDAFEAALASIPVPAALGACRLAPRILREGSILRSFAQLIKEDAGSVKLPVEREFFIKLFLDLDYKITTGGKGSHLKLTKSNSPLAIIPSNKELAKGTAKNLMRIYEQAQNMEQARRLPFEETISIKAPSTWTYDKPPSHRIDFSAGYSLSENAFVAPKEFLGVLQRDLYVVRYHSSFHAGKPHKHKTWMPLVESDRHDTLKALIESLANPISPEELTHVSVARVPAGQLVRFLHGKTKPRVDLVTNEIQKGGSTQYRFFDFDPEWILETREFPK